MIYFFFDKIIPVYLCSGLRAPLSGFVNIKLRGGKVFCASCKGHIGYVGEGGVPATAIIRHFRLVRIDPRYVISVCHGRLRNDDCAPMPHNHLSHVASVERSIDSPISPIELRDYEAGHLLAVPCPYSRDLMLNVPLLFGTTVTHLNEQSRPLYENISEPSPNPSPPEVPEPQSFVSITSVREEPVESDERAVAMSDRDWDDFIHNQPSTSGNTYSRGVRRLQNLRKLKRNYDRKDDHTYVQGVTYIRFKFI